MNPTQAGEAVKAKIDNYEFRPDAKIVQSHTTGKNIKMTVIAEGEWSGRDMEMLYELIGHALREGAYDPPEFTP